MSHLMPDQNFLASLRAEQLRLHTAAFKGAFAGSALLGVVLAAMLRHSVERQLLGAWLACLALALGVRMALLWWQRQRPQAAAKEAQRLTQLRATFLLHGLVWCAAGVVFLPKLGQMQADLLVLALVAICVGSIINTTFDLWASALFSLPTLALLAGHFATAGKGAAATGIIVAGFVVVVALSAARGWRNLRHSIVRRERDVSALSDAGKSLRITAAAANSIDDMLSVAGEDEVHSSGFEDGHDVLPHLDEILLFVGIMGALGVGGMMPVGDDPVCLRLFEVCFEPLRHLTVGAAGKIVRVQTEEMRAGEIP